VALNWFEIAASLGDDIIKTKASAAVKEISELMAIASEVNGEIINKYKARSERVE
jgi:hypothetical protein